MRVDIYNLLVRARASFRDGRIEDGLSALDGIIDAKWHDVNECARQYRMFDHLPYAVSPRSLVSGR